jgi:predicted outer membrane repeat protein
MRLRKIQNCSNGSASSPRRIFTVNSGIEATIEKMTLTGGYVTSTSGYDGGAILNNGNLTLNSVVIVDNHSDFDAGGIKSSGVLHIADSSFLQNTAALGGAIYTDANFTEGLVIERTLLFDNDANSGGALYIDGNDEDVGTATILNCTFSGNTATTGVGGAFRTGSEAPLVRIINSTITQNQSQSSGGGIYKHSASNITLHNTIVAGNVSVTTTTENISGTMNSASSYNLIGVGGAGGLTNTQGNQVNVADPGLDALADNGGPTKTHALLSTSPAKNLGSDAVVDDYELSTDQRGEGFARKIGVVDIGAFEYGAGSGGGAVVELPLANNLVASNTSKTINIDPRVFEESVTRQLRPNRRTKLIQKPMVSDGQDAALIAMLEASRYRESLMDWHWLDLEEHEERFEDAVTDQYFAALGDPRPACPIG